MNKCDKCNGTGQYLGLGGIYSKCDACKGTGFIVTEESKEEEKPSKSQSKRIEIMSTSEDETKKSASAKAEPFNRSAAMKAAWAKKKIEKEAKIKEE